MHAIAIKLAWVIALTLCSRDMGSVHLEGKNTEKSRGYKDYLKSKGLHVVFLRIMASPRRSLYVTGAFVFSELVALTSVRLSGNLEGDACASAG